MSEKQNPRPYFFIPFGRYEGNRHTEFPGNEILVGREKQRAELLKHLFSAGKRGAYLITGHRGSGKTSFVHHCLREYQDDIYQRYLQRNIGRAFLWDRAGQLFLTAVLLLVGLLLSEALAYLLANPEPHYLALPVIAIFTILLMYPWIAAFKLFRVALELTSSTEHGRLARILQRLSNAKPTHTPIKPNLAPVGLTFLGLALSLTFPPLSSPELGIAYAIFVSSLTVCVTHWSSAWPDTGQLSAIPTDDPSIELHVKSNETRFRWLLPWLGLFGGAFLGSFPIFASWTYNWQIESWGPTLLVASSILMALAYAARFRHHRKPSERAQGVSKESLTSSSQWYLTASVSCAVASFVFNATAGLAAMTILAATLIVTLSAGPPHKVSKLFNPRPRIILLLKGGVLLLIGNQLLFPILARIFPTFQFRLMGVMLIRPQAILASRVDTIFSTANSDGHLIRPEFTWLTLAMVLILILDATEYDWIIRPLSKMREDFSLHRSGHTNIKKLSPTPDEIEIQIRHPQLREDYKKATRETFFWKIHSLWLPVLVVPVNLGFDLLDQRLVVEAMLAGLRSSYRKVFLRATSVFTAVSRGLLLIFLVLLSIMLEHQLFALDGDSQRQAYINRTLCRDYVTSGWRAATDDSVHTGVWLSCKLGGETLLQALLWTPLYSPPSQTLSGGARPAADPFAASTGPLLRRVLKLSPEGRQSLFALPISFFFLFMILGFVASRLLKTWGLPPYPKMDQRMTNVIDGLSGTLREESRPQNSPFGNWINTLTSREVVRLKEGGPFDPRTVELSFLEILSDLQDPGSHFPFWSHRRISPPIPEVIFVFDELDKVGASNALGAAGSGPEEEIGEPLDQERDRTRALHRLFADLKNTICSGDARFIFIGGRNLHDEWLADQTARRPLLTHIFNLEIYIPSLLTDGNGTTASGLQGIAAFLRRQKYRADHAFHLSRLKRLRPWLTLWVEKLEPPSFVQLRFPNTPDDFQLGADGSSPWPNLLVFDSNTGAIAEPDGLFEAELHQFLAYRSKGNVKRLEELMESFIDPIDSRDVPTKAFSGPSFFLYGESGDCDHIMAFGSRDRFRIELIADLYRRLIPILDTRVRLRDDKLPQAILYLADFLLKFHRRAFAWSNVERVDELVHIHRAPDLRQSMQGILEVWDDRFLHRIRNGMYDFRCTSEFARELEYMSRVSDEELAAFNFTLDESQFLKAIYRSRIDILGDAEGVDFVAGLAELHKFDEEYELARAYLRRAIAVLDLRYRKEMKRKRTNPVRESFDASDEGFRILGERLSWGISRIRLMLQVGMTFERARNLEHAQLEYREARTLAFSLVSALTGWWGEASKLARQTKSLQRTAPFEDQERDWDEQGRLDFLVTLKHLYVVFQPLLAEAWLVEKMGSGVETAPALLDSELWTLREMLPFVNSHSFSSEPITRGALDIRHSNFALILAELHNKAGDLLFFKGRQPVPLELSKAWAAGTGPRSGAEGYLLRALQHYCIGLHDLRRLIVYRKTGSRFSHGLPTSDPIHEPWETIVSEGWSDFTFRVAAGALADLGDTLLARCSYTRLVGILNKRGTRDSSDQAGLSPRRGLSAAYDLLVRWFETGGEELRANPQLSTPRPDTHPATLPWFECCKLLSSQVEDNSISDWMALPEGKDKRSGHLIDQNCNNEDPERLVSALLISLVAARMLSRCGAFEAAGQQYLRVAQAIASISWTRLTLHSVFSAIINEPGQRSTWGAFADPQQKDDGCTGALDRSGEVTSSRYFQDLVSIAAMALERAADSFAHTRRTGWFSNNTNVSLQVGMQVPAEALSVACSLGLVHAIAAKRLTEGAIQPCKTQIALSQLCLKWLQLSDYPADICSLDIEGLMLFYRSRLQQMLAVRRYPKLNNLIGVKTLVDSITLDCRSDCESVSYSRNSLVRAAQEVKEVCTAITETLVALRNNLGEPTYSSFAELADSALVHCRRSLSALELFVQSSLARPSSDFQRIAGAHRQALLSLASATRRLQTLLDSHKSLLIQPSTHVRRLLDSLTRILSDFARGRHRFNSAFQDFVAIQREVNSRLEPLADYLLNLIQGDEEYDSPLHFTPLQLGTSLSTIWILLMRNNLLAGESTEFSADEIRGRAQSALRRSQQMYTQQRAFYNSIANLHYLYDDFNDRTVHFHHAVQMVGSELATFLYRNLEQLAESAPQNAGDIGAGLVSRPTHPSGR